LLGSFRWYDALYINQQDDIGRSHQLKMMGRIYEQACTVLVHIQGMQSGPSEVKALVGDIKDLIKSSSGLENMKILSANNPLLIDPRWKSIALFKQML
jgi:hypothetical protein